MVDLRKLGKDFIAPHIQIGGTVCDFTMGNGHDTAWLSKAVGKSGKVYAFDIQQAALDSTRKTLEREGVGRHCLYRRIPRTRRRPLRGRNVGKRIGRTL